MTVEEFAAEILRETGQHATVTADGATLCGRVTTDGAQMLVWLTGGMWVAGGSACHDTLREAVDDCAQQLEHEIHYRAQQLALLGRYMAVPRG